MAFEPERVPPPTKQGYDDGAEAFPARAIWSKKYFSLWESEAFRDGPDGDTCPTGSRARPRIHRKTKANRSLLLSFYSVHTPLIGRPDLVAKYKKKAAEINGAEFEDEEMTWPKNGKTARSAFSKSMRLRSHGRSHGLGRRQSFGQA